MNLFLLLVLLVLFFILGIGVGDFIASNIVEDKLKHLDKVSYYYTFMNQWLRLKQRNYKIDSLLIERGYMNIGIYGMKEFGERLIDELNDSSVHIECYIDKNPDNLLCDYEILSDLDKLPEVDAIVVTAIADFEAIERELKTKVNCDVISLQALIWTAKK